MLCTISVGRDPTLFLKTLAEVTDGVFVWRAKFEKELTPSAWPSGVIHVRDSHIKDLIRKPLLVCGSLYMMGPFKALLAKILETT